MQVSRLTGLPGAEVGRRTAPIWQAYDLDELSPAETMATMEREFNLPGRIQAVYDSARRLTVPIGILSNMNGDLWKQAVRPLRIHLTLGAQVVTSAELHLRKPSKEIYQEASRRMRSSFGMIGW